MFFMHALLMLTRMSVISLMQFFIISAPGYRNIEDGSSFDFLSFPGLMKRPATTAVNIASRLVASITCYQSFKG